MFHCHRHNSHPVPHDDIAQRHFINSWFMKTCIYLKPDPGSGLWASLHDTSLMFWYLHHAVFLGRCHMLTWEPCRFSWCTSKRCGFLVSGTCKGCIVRLSLKTGSLVTTVCWVQHSSLMQERARLVFHICKGIKPDNSLKSSRKWLTRSCHTTTFVRHTTRTHQPSVARQDSVVVSCNHGEHPSPHHYPSPH